MKTAEEIIKSYPELESFFNEPEFNSMIEAMESYASQFQQGYPKEFVEWIADGCLQLFEHPQMFDTKPNYAELVWFNYEKDKDYTLDEMYEYWQTNIKDK